MAVGPMVIDDVHYFHSSGAMASDEWVEFREDWYYFNKDGSSQETAGLATFIMWINWEPWCGTSG